MARRIGGGGRSPLPTAIESKPFAVGIIRRAYALRTHGHTDKAVLAALAFHADKDGYTFVGQDTLAFECQLARETVLRAMRRLEKAGLVRRTRRNDRKGHGTSDGIVLSLPEVVQGERESRASRSQASNAHDAGPCLGDGQAASKVTEDHRNSQINNQNNSQNPPAAFGLENEGFERLWRAYPHYGHRSDRRQAQAAFERLSGEERHDLGKAVGVLRAQPWITNEGGRYVRALERWIADDFWRDFVP